MPDLKPYWDKAVALAEESIGIVEAGGWAMWALAGIAVAMFLMGVHIWLKFRRSGFRVVRERKWRGWLAQPATARGMIGSIIAGAAACKEKAETEAYFEDLRTTESRPFERDLRVMKVCVSAAPLVGLLGTVTGMLSTFAALGSGSGGDQAMAEIAKGISEALITTMTGLVVALPGVFFHFFLERKLHRFKGFVDQVQSVVMQGTGRKRAAELRLNPPRLMKRIRRHHPIVQSEEVAA